MIDLTNPLDALMTSLNTCMKQSLEITKLVDRLGTLVKLGRTLPNDLINQTKKQIVVLRDAHTTELALCVKQSQEITRLEQERDSEIAALEQAANANPAFNESLQQLRSSHDEGKRLSAIVAANLDTCVKQSQEIAKVWTQLMVAQRELQGLK